MARKPATPAPKARLKGKAETTLKRTQTKARTAPSVEEPVKRRPGRPKGAKNKPKATEKAASPVVKPPVVSPRVKSKAALKPSAARSAAAKPAQARPEAAPPPSSPQSAAADPIGTLTTAQREGLEKLSVNLARAALTAQGAVTGAMLKQGDASSGGAPDPFHVGPALTEVAAKLASNPQKLMQAQGALFEGYMNLWKTASQRALGEEAVPVVGPAKGDKRFNDPDWSANPVFDMMKQSYLLTSNWLNGLVGEVEGVEPLTKRRVEFFTKMLTDAFSPSNFLATNPAALREAMASNGESLLRGAEKFAADLERGGGQLAISQTDAERFKVGENIATAPGKVVFENGTLQLLQFAPSTDKVHEIPLLIFPPWINKYYIMDLRPENSMIRWLTAQGYTVFVASWVNPDQSMATKTIEDYMFGGVYAAVEQVLKQTGAERANAVGYCIGGTLLSCALAHMAAKGDKRIGAATFFAAQQDFTEAGDLLLFTNEEWLADLDKRMDAAGGVLPSGAMAETFNMLRANDLIWSFFVSNYLMGKEPAAFDLLFWNSDQTRMPRALHMSYLRDFYKDNRLALGTLTLDNTLLDLGKVTIPVYVQSSKEDHIAPLRSVYRGAKLFGGSTTFTMAGSGHIAGVINHPDAKKYQHWTNAALPTAVDEWLTGAVEAPGSWWPHWDKWLAGKSGKDVPARDPAKGPLKPIEDAPGRYVKVKSAG